MNNASHTPTPWTIVRRTQNKTCTIRHGKIYVPLLDVNNATIIVRAVNNHEELLHLVKVVEAYFEADQIRDLAGNSGKKSHLHKQLKRAIAKASLGGK